MRYGQIQICDRNMQLELCWQIEDHGKECAPGISSEELFKVLIGRDHSAVQQIWILIFLDSCQTHGSVGMMAS